MESRERVLKAISHQETDRVPFDMFGTYAPGKERIRTFMKASSDEEMYSIFGIDFWEVGPFWPLVRNRFENGKHVDEWGIPYENYSNCDVNAYYPLSDVFSVDEVESYKWPVIDNYYTDHIQKEIESHNQFAITASMGAPIFHQVGWLCGFENMLVNLLSQPEVSDAIIRKLTDFWIEYAKRILDIGKGRIDIIETRNDFGAQDSMIISPELFRRFFKSAFKRLYDTIKQYDVKILHHSCGSITPIIPDFIEIGADILNPIQVTAYDMDPATLKLKFGDKLTFHGGIDTQYVLPNGTTDDVRNEVQRMIGILAKGGGYVLCGSQGLEADVPVENIIAMYDEGRKVRQY